MGLFSFLKGQEPAGAGRAGAAVVDPVQAARGRARRRLVGAAVLLGVGVIGFPLLFETQPRPIPVDIPIDIPRKEAAPSLPLPPPRVASAAALTPRVSSGVITERAPEPKREATPAAPPAAPPTKSAEAAPAPPPAVSKAASPPADDGKRASALLEGRPVEPRPAAAQVATAKPGAGKSAEPAAAAAKASAAATAGDDKPDASAGRFVVQVAAYSEASAARDMRQRVEKLGLKSYTQVIEIDGAKRIRVRVGPFPARDEAEKAAATLKAAGLPAAVFTL